MKTLKLAFCLCLLLSFFNSEAQTNHEIGTQFSGLNNFFFLYKKQKSENKFTRYSLGVATFQFQKSGNLSRRESLGLAFGVGFEKRKTITENFYFIHGFSPGLSIQYSSTNDSYNMLFEPRLGYILGFQHNLSEKFAVSIQTTPGLSAVFAVNDRDGWVKDDYDIRGGFSSNAVSLSVLYRFKK